MRSVIILGTNDFSVLMKKYMDKFTNVKVMGFACHEKFIYEKEIEGYPVISIENLAASFPPEDVEILPSIGYTKLGQLRKMLVNELRDKGYSFRSFIHPSVSFYGEEIGEGNIVLENVTFCLNSQIGNFNIVFNNSSFAHDTSIGDFNHFSPCVATSGHTTIGNHCFLGTNATTRNHIEISDYSFVGAGAYVSRSADSGSFIVPLESQNTPERNRVLPEGLEGVI